MAVGSITEIIDIVRILENKICRVAKNVKNMKAIHWQQFFLYILLYLI